MSLSNNDISVIFFCLSQNYELKFSFDFVGKSPRLVHVAEKNLIITALNSFISAKLKKPLQKNEIKTH